MPSGVLVLRKAARERAILAALASGQKGPEIARSLGLTHSTLRMYVSELLSDLGARTRAQAVCLAMERGIIETPRQK